MLLVSTQVGGWPCCGPRRPYVFAADHNLSRYGGVGAGGDRRIAIGGLSREDRWPRMSRLERVSAMLCVGRCCSCALSQRLNSPARWRRPFTIRRRPSTSVARYTPPSAARTVDEPAHAEHSTVVWAKLSRRTLRVCACTRGNLVRHRRSHGIRKRAAWRAILSCRAFHVACGTLCAAPQQRRPEGSRKRHRRCAECNKGGLGLGPGPGGRQRHGAVGCAGRG